MKKTIFFLRQLCWVSPLVVGLIGWSVTGDIKAALVGFGITFGWLGRSFVYAYTQEKERQRAEVSARFMGVLLKETLADFVSPRPVDLKSRIFRGFPW